MIGKKLKELIKLRNIKQIRLAKYVGISPSRLSNYLSDKREPDLDMLAKMARYLQVDLNYFTDIKFPVKKDASYAPPVMEEEELSDNVSVYAAGESTGLVQVPLLTINSKKRASKSNLVPVSSMFLDGVESPTDNAVLFEVTTGIGGDMYKCGDYILAAKVGSVKHTSGALVFETGRNGKSYRYLESNGTRVLVGKEEKDMLPISDEDGMEGFYVIVWVFKKP